jgi:zinc/manganese transport system substrate-binding protein/manganese/iron transport system substrate-binding protein
VVVKRKLPWAVAATAALALGACSGGEDGANGGDALQLIASNGIVADWVANVAGDGAEVSAIIPPGADLHSFQLSPSSIRQIGEADLVFLVGASLEASFEGVVRENASAPVVELSEGLALAEAGDEDGHEDDDDGHGDGEFDPHIWMDADLAIDAVGRIAEELSVIDPGGASIYTANAERYASEVRAMDEAIAARLAQLPPQRKLLVTFHDAYGYFADRYGLTVLGFVVENADEEPSAGAIADLVDAMEAADAMTIYIEPQFNARVVEQVAAETGAEVRTIPSDALSDEYPTYIALMEAIAAGIAD